MANTLDLVLNGAVGFIDWLDVARLMLIRCSWILIR